MSESTPICRCRVLYLGSSVPRQSKDGLQGIQEPLRNLYPPEGAIGAKGIDSWLSVWSNGILMENVDENLQNITRFFPIESLHYCAAVRRVLIPDRNKSNSDPKFLPLDSPFARMPRAQHPPIFSAILRRTTGIKVLECHVFICKREAAANALVRCCFHAYADNSYLQQLEVCGKRTSTYSNVYGTLNTNNNREAENEFTSESLKQKNFFASKSLETLKSNCQAKYEDVLSESDLGVNNFGDNTTEGYTSVKNFFGSSGDLHSISNGIEIPSSASNGNHKIWNGFPEDENALNVENGTTNTMTSGNRSSRSRQISAPIDIEPPPMVNQENNISLKKVKRPGTFESQSLSGSLTRPKFQIHQNSLQRSLYRPSMEQELHRQAFHQPISKRFNNAQGNFPCSGRLLKESYHHSPPCYSNIHLYMPTQHQRSIYPEYATLQPSLSAKKQKKISKNHIPQAQLLNITPIVSYQNSLRACMNPSNLQSANANTHLPTSCKDLDLSANDNMDETLNSSAESFGGTGIYKRRGHLNERAFSYSIRQEHRSRSHGSLAGLKFSPPEKSKVLKTEKDVSQMVAALQIYDADKN